MRVVFIAGAASIAASAFSFWLEPVFPLGDWRWGLVGGIALIVMWWAHRDSHSRPTNLTFEQHVELSRMSDEKQKYYVDVIFVLAIFFAPIGLVIALSLLKTVAD